MGEKKAWCKVNSDMNDPTSPNIARHCELFKRLTKINVLVTKPASILLDLTSSYSSSCRSSSQSSAYKKLSSCHLTHTRIQCIAARPSFCNSYLKITLSLTGGVSVVSVALSSVVISVVGASVVVEVVVVVGGS